MSGFKIEGPEVADALSRAVRDYDAKRLQSRVKQLEEALSRSMTALNDWQNSYASDMCDPHSVEETDARLSEYGVLAYIANVQQQNRLALLNGGSNERD